MNANNKSYEKGRALMAITVVAFMLTGCAVFPNDNEDSLTTAPTAALTQTTNSPNTTETVSTGDMDFAFSDRDKDASYDEADATKITLTDAQITIDGEGASVDNDTLTITSEGVYILTGKLSNGRIIVDVGDNDKVQIVLNSVEIHCDYSAPIYIKAADKVFLTLAQDTQNALSDGSEYESVSEDNIDAVVFSKADLTFNGSGSLSITANYKHAVVSKDDLIVTGGSYAIEALSGGLHGKDCVKIGGGDIIIDAGGDAIQSDNAEDSTRGFVYIEDGSLNITSESDGIQAETVLYVTGGSIVINSGGGSQNASTDSSGNVMPGWGAWGASDNSADTGSAKGLKAEQLLLIEGGTISIDSSDDSLHSNGDIVITNGELNILSGDDGAHADSSLTINGGRIDIGKSYEGIEASIIQINDGDISIISSDDGINAAGGADSSALGQRPGKDNFNVNNGSYFKMTDGFLLIDADGDGLDSNGSIYIEGGVILASGSNEGVEVGMDYIGEATVSGGVVMITGSYGMAQTFSSTSQQGSIMCSFNSSVSENIRITLTDSNAAVLASYTFPKSFQTIVISAPGITVGESYTLYSDGEVDSADENGFASEGTLSGGGEIGSISVTSISTVIGGNGNMGGGR